MFKWKYIEIEFEIEKKKWNYISSLPFCECPRSFFCFHFYTGFPIFIWNTKWTESWNTIYTRQTATTNTRQRIQNNKWIRIWVKWLGFLWLSWNHFGSHKLRFIQISWHIMWYRKDTIWAPYNISHNTTWWTNAIMQFERIKL